LFPLIVTPVRQVFQAVIAINAQIPIVCTTLEAAFLNVEQELRGQGTNQIVPVQTQQKDMMVLVIVV
jgi:hypothetical protein